MVLFLLKNGDNSTANYVSFTSLPEGIKRFWVKVYDAIFDNQNATTQLLLFQGLNAFCCILFVGLG